MKIAVYSPNVNWVLDEIAKDYTKNTKHKIVSNFQDADIIWCLDVFGFDKFKNYSCTKVITVHHINEDDIGAYNFGIINKADFCIVPNDITMATAKKYLSIPIYKLPYWLLSKNIQDKINTTIIKSELCPNSEVLIGSFVKDGNGQKGDVPKTVKNPDMFLDVLYKISNSTKIKVLLGGYARNYVIKNLKSKNIPYVYYERYYNVNLLYDCLDWYFVTSKYEGGPQAILETSYRKVKVLSTNVGMAPEVLHNDCVCQNSSDFVDRFKSNIDRINYNYDVVKNRFMMDKILPEYDAFFNNCVDCKL